MKVLKKYFLNIASLAIFSLFLASEIWSKILAHSMSVLKSKPEPTLNFPLHGHYGVLS